MEAILLASALFANALFLFVRHLFIQNNQLNMNNAGHTAETDFLESRQIEIGLLSAWVTQLVMTVFLNCISFFYPSAPFSLHGSEQSYLNLLIILYFCQICFGFFLFFVHNFESDNPKVNKCWNAVGPWVHSLLAIFNYIAAPAASFICYFTFEQDT
jgi:hypothetical protein